MTRRKESSYGISSGPVIIRCLHRGPLRYGLCHTHRPHSERNAVTHADQRPEPGRRGEAKQNEAASSPGHLHPLFPAVRTKPPTLNIVPKQPPSCRTQSQRPHTAPK